MRLPLDLYCKQRMHSLTGLGKQGLCRRKGRAGHIRDCPGRPLPGLKTAQRTFTIPPMREYSVSILAKPGITLDLDSLQTCAELLLWDGYSHKSDFLSRVSSLVVSGRLARYANLSFPQSFVRFFLIRIGDDEREHFIDGHWVGKPGKSGSAEPLTLDRNLNVLREISN